MRIGTRAIGPDHPPYIIAELGVNHDGSVDRALQLVDAAADAGADAVKLQLFDADLLMSKASKLAAYQKAAGEHDPLAMLKRLQLSTEQMKPVVARAHAINLHAIVTVFSVELVPEAERMPWDAYKTASPDIIHRPLLEALARTRRPLILSTGAATLNEVAETLSWLGRSRHRVAVLQCVSSYPTPDDSAELGGIPALAGIFSGAVGYSDHTAGEHTGARAVEHGACILEKHFTLDSTAPGPDHRASLEPAAMKHYITHARAASINTTQTKPLKRVLPIEHDVRAVSRQSIVATRDLPTGHTITRADLTFKRPGTGLPPYMLSACLGATVTSTIEADTPISSSSLDASMPPALMPSSK